ncbi:MAG: DegT/DnrJ/EryC1/StrS family aminotransferase [Gammaproteobacteria bacterium]|nr:DegT/DnrJ/EryC1/StrS family aminotransferase [Gammaproteobacteria bacterium]
MIHTADPRAGYLALKTEIDAAIARVLEGGQYILGETVERFEREFAAWLGVPQAVGVGNGTDALHLALRALDIGAGDEVIVPSLTAVATVAAVEMAGAEPVLADVDPVWRTLDPAQVAGMASPRTRAVIAVHLYGQPADLDTLGRYARASGAVLIEDCAQAHGARWRGSHVGTVGAAAAFSFYPTKNLGALGDGGLVATADAGLAERLRALRQYGWREPQRSSEPGWNSRLDALQAAVLSVRLARLDTANARRRELAGRYARGLEGLPLELPREREGSEHVFHLYVVRCADRAARDGLLAHLAKAGIRAGIHYPSGVHEQPAYRGRLRAGSMAATERITATALSLPLYPELADADQQRVIDAVRSWCGAGR